MEKEYSPPDTPNTCISSLVILLYHSDDGRHDGLLVIKASLLPQHGGQECHQHVMLAWELDTDTLYGLHHDGLELVRDLRHEGGDLFHESLHTPLAPRLEQSGDGQGGNAAVVVRDEVLQVHIAGGDGIRVEHGDAIQCLHS